jgi:hypothetical protein
MGLLDKILGKGPRAKLTHKIGQESPTGPIATGDIWYSPEGVRVFDGMEWIDVGMNLNSQGPSKPKPPIRPPPQKPKDMSFRYGNEQLAKPKPKQSPPQPEPLPQFGKRKLDI